MAGSTQPTGVPATGPPPSARETISLEYLQRWELPLLGAGYVLERPLLAQAAADGITALLDGQGGDELFGFSPYFVADRIRAGRLLSSVRLARSFPNLGHQAPWRHTLKLWRRFGFNPAVPYALHERARKRRRRVPAYLSRRSADVFVETDTSLRWKRNPDGPLWWSWKASVLTHDREEIGLPEYLRHRAALAGLDARLPLMDLGLIETALAVPPDYEFDRQFDRPLISQAMKGSVPDEVRLSQSKSNLAPYYHQGVAEHDLPFLRRLLLAPDAEVLGYVDPAFVRKLMERAPRVGDRGWISWLSPVWALATAETWLRHQSDPGHVERLLGEGPPQPAWGICKAPR